MSELTVIKVSSKEEAGKKIADIFSEVISKKPDCVIGLATGSSPLPVYKEFVEREKSGSIDFSKVRSVNLDEYKGLAPTHPQSYRYFMQENLFDHISIKKENTLVPDGLAKDGAEMCENYERKIREWGGIDIQLLGIGHDGHIAFNEPDKVFPPKTHQAELTPVTREANKRFFSSIDEVPVSAYTMGIGTIMRAKKLVMIVTGKDKAEILKKSLFGPVVPEIPASILQFHPDFTVVCDSEAASLL